MPNWAIPNLFKRGVPTENIPPLGGEISQEAVSTHVHTWELITKTLARPRRDVDASKLPETLAQKVLFGVTTLIWECHDCGESKAEEVLGAEEDSFDNIFENARIVGPQWVEREGEKFVISRVAPQGLPGNLPLR